MIMDMVREAVLNITVFIMAKGSCYPRWLMRLHGRFDARRGVISVKDNVANSQRLDTQREDYNAASSKLYRLVLLKLRHSAERAVALVARFQGIEHENANIAAPPANADLMTGYRRRAAAQRRIVGQLRGYIQNRDQFEARAFQVQQVMYHRYIALREIYLEGAMRADRRYAGITAQELVEDARAYDRYVAVNEQLHRDIQGIVDGANELYERDTVQNESSRQKVREKLNKDAKEQEILCRRKEQEKRLAMARADAEFNRLLDQELAELSRKESA